MMQFPGPMSLLIISDEPIDFFIIVILEMPPIFKIQIGSLIFF